MQKILVLSIVAVGLLAGCGGSGSTTPSTVAAKPATVAASSGGAATARPSTGSSTAARPAPAARGAAANGAAKARSGSKSPPASPPSTTTAHAPPARGAAGILDAKKVPAPVSAALQRFTACMRSSGVPDFPQPQGDGFDLSATKLNPSSPQYRSAEAHCTAILEGVDTRGR